MAQPGNFTPILLYSSSTSTNVPLAANLTNSANGADLAINIADKNLFFKDSGGTVNTLPIRQSVTSSNGWLSSTDWNTFNNKAPATSGTSLLYGNGSGGFSNVTIGTGITFAGGTLSATGSGGTVTSVTGTSPVVSSGGTTPAISLATAYGDTLNPYASKTANYILAAPNGSAGVPTFRALVAADLPSLSGTYIPYTGASSAIDLNAQTVTNIAHLGINTTSVPTILIRAIGDNNSSSRIAMRGYSSNANSSSIRVTKFRGTLAAPQAPQSGDSLGKFELAGYGTTASDGYPQASYEGLATEAWGATARGTKTVFKVTPNTTTTQVTALTIDQDSTATFTSSVTATLFSGSGASLTSIPNSALVNSTISGVALGGSLFNLTAGTGVSFSAGTTYNGSAAITINATGTGGTVTSVAALTLGTSGTDLSSTVANGTTTPVITLNVPTASATNRGALSAADWTTFNSKQPAGTYVTSISIASSNGFTGTSSGGATPSLTLATSVTGILKGNGTAISAATSGTDYAPATSGSSILYGNGAGGFSNVTIGTGLSFTGGTLSSTASSGTVTSVAATVPAFLSISGSPITTSGTLAITLSGTALPVANGGTGLTSLTANYIPYGNGTSAFSSSSNLTYNGTTLAVGGYITSSGETVIGNYIANRASATAYNSGGGIQFQVDGVTYSAIAQPAAQALAFYTGNATTERMRIFSSGGISIGNTTDPGAGKLSVTNDAIISGIAVGIGAGSGSSNTVLGYIAGSAMTTASNNTFIGAQAGSNSTTGGNNIIIGTLTNLGAASDNNCIAIGVGTAGQGTNTTRIATYSGGYGSVYQGNNSTLWAITSDQRLKKNIVDNTDGLNKITAIKVRNFEYRLPKEIDSELKSTDAINIQGVQLGAIAQELQTILPDCVKQESTGIYRVDASNLTWYMVNAIKELNALVQTQAAQISKLQNKVGV